MKRRQFLKLLGATLLVGSARARETTALVVGAGMSGIAAAWRLKQHGFQVTVLEARNRLGGRIWTESWQGLPLDLGAMWIEGTDGNPVAEQARRLGVKTVPDTEEWKYYDFDGRLLDDEEELDWQEAQFARLKRLANGLEADLSMAEASRRVLPAGGDAMQRRRAQMFLSDIELTASAPADRLSFLYGSEYGGFDGPELLIPGGYLGVAAGLARGLDVKLGQSVKSIEHASDGVRVTTGKGAFEADFAVVTLPLGVLKSGAVAFDPPLAADKQSAIRRLEMGLLNKVILKFPRATWPNVANLGYLSNTAGEFPMFLNWHHFTGHPVLIGFVGGRYAFGLEKEPDARQVDKALAVLRKMVGQKLGDPVASRVSRWSQDPLAGGSYSYLPVGSTLDDYDVLARPQGTLLFAGEATDRELFASVNGAYRSGVREADRASELFG